MSKWICALFVVALAGCSAPEPAPSAPKTETDDRMAAPGTVLPQPEEPTSTRELPKRNWPGIPLESAMIFAVSTSTENGLVKASFKLKNEGDKPIQELAVQVDLYDTDGKMMEVGDASYNVKLPKPLEPGATTELSVDVTQSKEGKSTVFGADVVAVDVR